MPERRTLALFAALGLLVGGLVATALALDLGRSDVGWPVPVVVTLGAGLVAGLVVSFAAPWLRRRHLPVLAVAGVSIGLLVGLAVYVWGRYVSDGRRVTYHGRYVPLGGITTNRAYASTLDITFGRSETWWSLLLVGGVAGLAGGLACWAADAVLRSGTASTPG